MTSIPLWVFVAGVALGELFQWSKWISAHPGQPWRGYWQVGAPHLMGNAFAIVAVCVLWSQGWLDDAVNFVLPSSVTAAWSNVGIPYTPQVALFVGGAADVFGDQITYLIRSLASRRSGGAVRAPEPAPPGP